MVDSTLEDLILYMFDELTPHEKAQIESELKIDWALREKYHVLKESCQRLNMMRLNSPREQSIETILKYAKRPSKVSS